ncbi:MAG: type II toxin-antitoxin system PrlF family antitoxin [Caulobacteraceae bacterium]
MIESTLTDRYQTTVPKGVREALGLRRGDRLAYRLEGDRVIVSKAEVGEPDPFLEPFLALLARDIRDRPSALRPRTRAYMDELAALVEGVEADLDAPLDPEA